MKRILAFILVLALALSALAIPVSALADGGVAVSGAERAKIAQLRVMVELANVQIAAMIRLAQATPWNDAALTVCLCERIVAGVLTAAECMNLSHARVECEHRSYCIDGQWVTIDPLKVINY